MFTLKSEDVDSTYVIDSDLYEGDHELKLPVEKNISFRGKGKPDDLVFFQSFSPLLKLTL